VRCWGSTARRSARRVRTDEARLTADVIAWRAYGRYGYRRITALLNEAGWGVKPLNVLPGVPINTQFAHDPLGVTLRRSLPEAQENFSRSILGKCLRFVRLVPDEEASQAGGAPLGLYDLIHRGSWAGQI
jgi:hypothetical protein